MTDVLITYAWVRSSYAALRNLTKHGLDVWVTDANSAGMCQWSRRKSGFTKGVSHYQDELAFVNQIASLCLKLGVRYVLASHNETEILAKHRHRLPPGVDAFLPDYEHCRLFNNKARSYEFAKAAGIPVPARIEYTEISEIESRVAERGLDRVVVKLLTGNSAKGVFYAESAGQAQRLVSDLVQRYSLLPDRYPQIEERVVGTGVGCSVLYWNGQPIADFCHRRLREKTATGGTSTLREVLHHEQLRAATHKLFSSAGWHGLAMAEFKLCERTGEFWFIEVNPRMWGSIPLSISAGVEFPYLLWLCATEGSDAARAYDLATTKKFPWRGRWLFGDIILALSQLAKLDLKGMYSSLCGAKADALDDFFLDDPGAFVGELAHYGGRFLATRSLNPEERGMVG